MIGEEEGETSRASLSNTSSLSSSLLVMKRERFLNGAGSPTNVAQPWMRVLVVLLTLLWAVLRRLTMSFESILVWDADADADDAGGGGDGDFVVIVA